MAWVLNFRGTVIWVFFLGMGRAGKLVSSDSPRVLGRSKKAGPGAGTSEGSRSGGESCIGRLHVWSQSLEESPKYGDLNAVSRIRNWAPGARRPFKEVRGQSAGGNFSACDGGMLPKAATAHRGNAHMLVHFHFGFPKGWAAACMFGGWGGGGVCWKKFCH